MDQASNEFKFATVSFGPKLPTTRYWVCFSPLKPGNWARVLLTECQHLVAYPMLVLTKSVNSNFCALWLAPVTRNMLAIHCFATGAKMASRFEIFGRRNLCDKWSSRTNKYQRRRTLACRCLLVGILMLNLQQNRKMHLTKSPKCL